MIEKRCQCCKVQILDARQQKSRKIFMAIISKLWPKSQNCHRSRKLLPKIIVYLNKNSTYEFFHDVLLKYERKFIGCSGNSEWIHNLRNYSFQLQGFCNVKGVVTFDPWVDVIANGLKALIGSQGDSKYRVNETFLRSLTVSAPLRTNCQSQCPLSHVPNICPSTKKIFVKSDFFLNSF